MPADSVIDTATFAILAEMTDRGAKKTCAKCHKDKGATWRGVHLKVITEHGAGGNAGLRYLVAVSSLPTELRERLADTPAETADPDENTLRSMSDYRRRTAIFRRDVVREAKLHGVKQTSRIERRYPNGSVKCVKPSTIYEWMAKEAKGGIAALVSKPRKDLGRSRVIVSRCFDDAWPHGEKRLKEVADAIELHARSLFAASLGSSIRSVARSCSHQLFQHAVKAGLKGDDAALRGLCKLSNDWAARSSSYKHLAIYEKDRKRYFDKSQARITRGRDGMVPMEVVYGDVTPMDFILHGANGERVRGFMIGWLDHATRRLSVYPIFCGARRGVRKGDIVEAFIALTQDERWGVPRTLYLDNGGEYNALDLMQDAMCLATVPEVPSFKLHDIVTAPKSIQKAKPYNAPAKVIESIFSAIMGPSAHINGHIGGDRMRKKTHSVGQEPLAYSGTLEEFRTQVLEMVEIYNGTVQSSGASLQGHSPNAVFDEAIDAGWMRTDIDPMALDAVFSIIDHRTVRSSQFDFDKKKYYCDAVAEKQGGERVTLRVPIRTGVDYLFVYDENEKLIDVARPDRQFHPTDKAGAKEGGRREGIGLKKLREMRKNTKPIDPHADALEVVRALPAPKVPESAGTVRYADEMAAEVEELSGDITNVAVIREREMKDEKEERRRKSEEERRRWREEHREYLEIEARGHLGSGLIARI